MSSLDCANRWTTYVVMSKVILYIRKKLEIRRPIRAPSNFRHRCHLYGSPQATISLPSSTIAASGYKTTRPTFFIIYTLSSTIDPCLSCSTSTIAHRVDNKNITLVIIKRLITWNFCMVGALELYQQKVHMFLYVVYMLFDCNKLVYVLLWKHTSCLRFFLSPCYVVFPPEFSVLH
jgi:hypothetical protein